MATFKRFQVKSNGMAEYRQEGNTATVRFGKTFWKEGTEPPAELTITLPDGTSIQDLVGVKEKKSGLTEEEKAAKAAEKAKSKEAKDAERAAAREARKAERDAERAKRDEERKAEREKRAAEREAARAANPANAEVAPAAEM